MAGQAGIGVGQDLGWIARAIGRGNQILCGGNGGGDQMDVGFQPLATEP